MSTRRSLWPQGLTSRVVLVLVIVMTAQFLAASLLIGQDESDIQREDLGKRIAEQLIVAERLIESVPADQRETLARALSTQHLEFELVTQPVRAAAQLPDDDLQELRSAIFAWEPSLNQAQLIIALDEQDELRLDNHLIGSVQVGEGSWLAFRTREPLADWRWATFTLLRVGLVAIVIFTTAAVLVRTLNRPLVQLAQSARVIGTEARVTFDEQTGPRELRRVSKALNAMQDRVDDVLDQRTRALAAVGHDMRTPLARIRLRIARIADPEERAAAEHDVEIMGRMLQELLDYFDTDEIAPRTRTDLASLCRTICDGFEDIGAPVLYSGPDRLIANVHLDILRRGIENLVNNAVRYGAARGLVLEAADDEICISVTDDGPGIPDHEFDRLVRPFERMDRARGEANGGIGLGLAITARVAEIHGGRLVLRNRDSGGLAAIIVLPAASSGAPAPAGKNTPETI